MHLDNGELVPDYYDTQDVHLHATALEWGTMPTTMGPRAKVLSELYDSASGDNQTLITKLPEGYFDKPMKGSEAVMRGCVKLAASNSALRHNALAHVALFGSEFINV